MSEETNARSMMKSELIERIARKQSHLAYKDVELAVKSTIEGSSVKNKEALANPEVLKQYKNLKQLSY